MDFTVHRRKIDGSHKIISDSLSDLYPHDVSMYTSAPAQSASTIALSEFEEAAVERLQLLRTIEQAALKGHKIFTEEWRMCVKEDLAKGGLKKFVRLMSGSSGVTDAQLQVRRLDHISHFILCLAYCRSEDLRRWFLAREVEWFRLKFDSQPRSAVRQFLELYNLNYAPMSDGEKENAGFGEELTELYKVWWREVCSLVKSRRVVIKSGYAFVPGSELVVCIQAKFRAGLSEKLNLFFRRLPLFDDDRVQLLLSDLHHLHTGRSYYDQGGSGDNKQVDPADLDRLARSHFPPCMRHLHQRLRADHHLKHEGRLQYGLFLKAIGLTFEDAVTFWREEFTRKIDSNKFEKDYLYNIKHMYGKVGKMTSYSPYSCMKVITGNVGAGQQHGCPFRHWDSDTVKRKAVEEGASTHDASQIQDLVVKGHYQVACGRYFECTHGGKAVSAGVNHPNQYFEESMNLETEAKEAKENIAVQVTK